MSKSQAGRRPRHARANAPHTIGFVLELEMPDDSWAIEWYPGTAAAAVAAARAKFPGCRIDHLYQLDWREWLLVMEDEKAALEDAVAMGLD